MGECLREEDGMNSEEFDEINKINGMPMWLSVDDLTDKSDRTLLYGYTSNRDTWHVYTLGGEIHLHVYGHKDETIFHVNHGSVVRAVVDIIPDKRLYPAACDAQACLLLVGRGAYFPFTEFDDRAERRFYGIVADTNRAAPGADAQGKQG